MPLSNRRQFLHGSVGLAAGFAVAGASAASSGAAVAQRGNVAVLGLDKAGLALVRLLAGRRDCALRAVCDQSSAARAKAVASAGKFGQMQPIIHADPRHLLDDPTLGAVFVAGAPPDRTRMAALALEAGKPVYVEMPAAFDPAEGDALAAAARPDRLCQAGLPSRSMAGIRQALGFLHGGKLGTVHLAHAVLYRRDLATDDATLVGRLVPLLDLARWGLGVDKHPLTVTAIGGRFTKRSAVTPDTLSVAFVFPERRLFVEVRSLTSAPLDGLKTGVVFHGDKGKLVCTASDSAVAYGPDGELLRVFKGSGDPIGNFLRAVRDGKSASLNAPLADGLASGAFAALALQGVTRGSPKPMSMILEDLAVSDPDTHEWFTRLTEHLAANHVSPDALCSTWQSSALPHPS